MSGTGGHLRAARRNRRPLIAALLVAVATIVPSVAARADGVDDSSTTTTSTTPTTSSEPTATTPPSSDPTTTTTTTTAPPAATEVDTAAAPPTDLPTVSASDTEDTGAAVDAAADLAVAGRSASADLAAPAAASLLAAPVGGWGCAVSRPIRVGYVGIDVQCLNNVLSLVGYWPDTGTTFTVRSSHALAGYQAANGLAVDGVATESALGSLGLWVAPPAPPTPPPAQVPTAGWGCAVSRPIRVGYVGIDVQCLNNVLSLVGYWPGTGNTFTVQSSHALAGYQAANGLVADGVAGPATLARLALWTTPTAGTPPAATGDYGCTVSRTVRVGDNGIDVQCLNNVLSLIGYWPDTGRTFDVASSHALAGFQAAVGLGADGIAGPATLARLGLWSPPPAPPADAPGQAGLPANSGTGRRVVYSRAQQRVWAVDEDGTVVKTHRVSGRLHEPYAGTYSVYSRSMYTYSAANPAIKWRYMVRFAYGPGGGRIGFHEIPNRNGVPMQSEGQLGQPLSGGCVRQSTADAQWMWNWAGVGTKVVVL
jgi:hypothetical protein